LRPGTIAASSPEPHNYKRSSPQPKKFDVKDGQQVSRVASSSTSLPIPLRLGTDVFVLEYATLYCIFVSPTLLISSLGKHYPRPSPLLADMFRPFRSSLILEYELLASKIGS
jgi:hypothetical protein